MPIIKKCCKICQLRFKMFETENSNAKKGSRNFWKNMILENTVLQVYDKNKHTYGSHWGEFICARSPVLTTTRLNSTRRMCALAVKLMSRLPHVDPKVLLSFGSPNLALQKDEVLRHRMFTYVPEELAWHSSEWVHVDQNVQSDCLYHLFSSKPLLCLPRYCDFGTLFYHRDPWWLRLQDSS